MGYQLEVLIVPVTDVDRSLEFYTQQAGFALDIDYGPSAAFRVVQLTPPGSSCSVQIGVGFPTAEPGTFRGMYLVVPDIEAARRDLTGRGVAVGDIRHKVPFDQWQGDYAPGVDPGHRDYASFADFADPDGNVWTLQERGFRST